MKGTPMHVVYKILFLNKIRELFTVTATKGAALPPNTTEESSQNSDLGDTKSLSPPTSVSEISADAEHRSEDQTPSSKMEIETESKTSPELPEERLTDISQDVVSTPTDASQDSSQNISPSSPEILEKSADDKVIPRLVNTSVPSDILNSVDPENWTTSDVAKFLTVNDCQPYCINFSHITGSMMLQLSKDEIIELLEMKVGPSLKIFDLIQQLKCKIKQPQCRLLGTFK
ncbi:jg26392 [Pararge aegeria aegeria]|uniref:Jg26392 protein n=1 Tax=Pararge aegeria aegeria TaxID=348720 RepID=A0A8S4R0X8_9NEOP|nr:jg26392 [Pararge aegeria aegeria]